MREDTAMAVPRRFMNHMGTLTLNTKSYTDIKIRRAQNSTMRKCPLVMRPMEATVRANSGPT